ncbi:MAG: 50S ribosomal protein L10 [Candidatus Diapherotrites archaeon]|jgi:large subunit ribosomal protein L10|uniref:50S ribosomal protein L10 n=1 Tax=Candidatus Iainarchaeum sp. TaxID=3101447 RepID=A0A8T5GED1_9ARCH|nr:50S ribosomal protein L10 [Candidatus Diapherotrites archaeon]MBT7241046.1 50S ribosomal protein L10 [Candidatus Diapherotrites archaeon]
MTSHNRAWKEAKKDELTKLSVEYPFIAVATLNELPASIVSVLRKRLAGEAVIKVSKIRVVKKAFAESSVDTSKIDDQINQSIAVIFSKKNPFELFSFIKKNKGEASAKVGDIAPQDILVQAGDTGLPPGPALTPLKAAGLKVAVQGPTISIVKDKIVTKKGEEVSDAVVDVLGKLNIKPMRVGMKVMGVLDKEENAFYSAESLDVDEEELFDNFVLAYQQALNLSVNAGIYNDASMEVLVIKAQREAKAVKEALGEDAPEEKTEEVKEETSEEAKEEVVVEAAQAPVEEVKEEAPVEEATVETPVEEVKEEPKKETPAEAAVETPVEEPKTEEVKEDAPTEVVEEVKKEGESN